ncbi:hypothetical protein [Paenalcaligenes sp.]|uniref:hypothetical protein n=1 Tax=Paenalcaligenes sp. TaxID=1966342 RepID=UPI0021B154BA|nr:hypothetical protein [Paenalcaligenes sp.]
MKKTRIKIAALALIGGGLAMPAQASLTMEGIAPEQILKVFNSPLGYVKGFLTEDEAVQLQLITRSREPIQVRTTIVHHYKQVGCARIQIDMQQAGVPTQTLQFITVDFPPIQLNMCANGDPPVLTEEVKRVTAQAEKRMREELIGAYQYEE